MQQGSSGALEEAIKEALYREHADVESTNGCGIVQAEGSPGGLLNASSNVYIEFHAFGYNCYYIDR